MGPAKTTVTIYSAPWCVYCRMAKEYLDSKGVAFKDVDIERQQAAAMYIMSKTGRAGVPVIEIGDSFILGFDRPRIDTALLDHKLV